MKKWNVLTSFVVVSSLSLSLADCSDPRSSSTTEHLNGEQARTLQFSYSVTVKDIPSNAGHVEMWLPVPKSDAYQTIKDFKVTSDFPYSFQNDPEYNNTILKVVERSEIPDRFTVSMEFMVTRRAYQVLDQSKNGTDSADLEMLQRYLLPDRLVPIDNIIAMEAQKVVPLEMADMEKARALYDHVVSSMTYDKTGTGWGQGDAIYACNARTGNCTDFHSLFIGMARASGMPSRFVIGFPIPEGEKQGDIPGYHCWAEFYIKDLGWVPIDASEANKYADKRNFFFGSLDANRVQFTIGRDITVEPNADIEPLNYFIYPYVRIDGKTYTDIEHHFSFKDLSEEVQ
jgi:transglutaminase-like putative cysteine protease